MADLFHHTDDSGYELGLYLTPSGLHVEATPLDGMYAMVPVDLSEDAGRALLDALLKHYGQDITEEHTDA
jgi:hypothetical protein